MIGCDGHFDNLCESYLQCPEDKMTSTQVVETLVDYLIQKKTMRNKKGCKESRILNLGV